MSVLKKPIVTEKISQLNEKGIYGFIVDNNSNKVEIRKEIEKDYSVKIEKVNTMRYSGKKKVRYKKTGILKGKTPSYKKAIIYLKEGEFLDFYGDV
ncbi:MAG: 50S ribosomal protein L23 [Bacteroidetes bacterium]|nr:50S ribosomal protein L23 [Bacteroidota bacterium]